jgi:ribosomal-protein-alanine N-acetyltransferase
MKYELMNESHTAQVAELEKACFSTPWSLRSITEELTNPLSQWIVAVEEQTVVGYVGSQSVMGEADMMNLAVDSAFRRKGIAEQLVLTLIEALKNRDVHSLTLEVRASNDAAISLYKKLEFSQVGRRPKYYANPQEDALILRKEWNL